jgi:hypothetical protein
MDDRLMASLTMGFISPLKEGFLPRRLRHANIQGVISNLYLFREEVTSFSLSKGLILALDSSDLPFSRHFHCTLLFLHAAAIPSRE